MNWNYSYRAFLITSLLCGSLILILYSIRLHGIVIEDEDLIYDVEIIPTALIDEEILEETASSQSEIETNRAFNQAEKEQSNLTRQSQQDSKEIEEKLAELDAAIENTSISNDDFNKKIAISSSDKEFRSATKKLEESVEKSGGNENTSVFYNLPGRQALFLPNPVYTCAASGKISVNIEVTATGRVSNVTYNKTASTSTNKCLIEAAKQYSYQSVFSTESSGKSQTGTITFVFPGQN